MPEPLERGRRYMPGLDGLRAFAVLAVIAYHLGFNWASGGLLGVAIFFTLSGYLITDLLLAQQAAGGIQLARFWLARARRLLPALLVVLLVVGIWVWADDRAQIAEVRGEVFGGLFYISNWWQSFQHISYFARFSAPSPLNHLWSLAVEEQFYLIWPWLLLLFFHFVRERPQSGAMRPRMATLILVLAVISAIEMAVLYRPSFDPSRVYYGTDTRAFGLLFGAALACVWPSRKLSPRVGPHAAWVIDAIGLTGLLGCAVMVFATSEFSPFIYRGGMVLVSIFTVMALAALTHPASRLQRWLGCRPMRWIGVRSYGIYLWHAPIIALTTPNVYEHVSLLRASLQVVASFVVAALSWHFVENPVRHGAAGRIWAQIRREGWGVRPIRAWAVGLGAAVLILVLGLSGAIGPLPLAPVVKDTNPAALASSSSPDPTEITDPSTISPSDTRDSTLAPATGTTTTTGPGANGPTSRRAQRLRTSCTSVVHIGDSTSDGLDSPQYLPDPHQRIPAQYRRVGVKQTTMEVTGGTSIVETLPGALNAQTVASNLIHGGYNGCWVIALGTNDVADIAVGSNVPLAERIDDMMKITGTQPVLWVTTKTLLASGPYADSGMQRWDQDLLAACSRYPSMRVYDWAAAAQDRWFIPDGIHYYSDGYAARAHLIANALAEAFPAAGQQPSCEVSTPTVNIPVRGVR